MTGLHLAAKHDAEDIAELLLETGEINVFHEDNVMSSHILFMVVVPCNMH